MIRAITLLLGAAIICGCEGQYILTVPDQVVPVGSDAPVVVRVQRYEFASWRMSIEGEPMRFRIADGLERCAFSDELGFAAATTPAPQKPGKYDLLVALQDKQGDEAAIRAPAFVWPADAPVAAVDLDSLPGPGRQWAPQAREAVVRLAKTLRIVCVTRISPYEHASLRAKVSECRYPDGPILVWRAKYRHFARTGPLRFPKLVTEARMVADLSFLRKRFKNLTLGVSTSSDSARAFRAAGLTPVVIGASKADVEGAIWRDSWSDLAERLPTRQP